MNFPLFNTKELSTGKVYDLNDPAGRREYFEAKLGKKMEELKEYLDNRTFLAFLLAKKSAGKGTYSKMFEEIVGPGKTAHISVGDLVRDTYKNINDAAFRDELISYMKKHYRGFITIDEAIDALLGKSQDKLLPTEFILALVKREIEKVGKKALFIDGLPRNLDQISYSLYFRDLINFRDDPDLFILIDVPESVIDERMKYRVICPVCHTSRNTKLLPTKFVKYNTSDDSYYLVCDNASCSGYGTEKMVRKEGDEQGINPIRERLTLDGKLMEMATRLEGVPKVYVRNAIPASEATNIAEEYELTPEFEYATKDNGEVVVSSKPWVVKDDSGDDCHSLMAASAMLSLVSQLHKILIG